ncbi:hypothetical protein, partial [Hyphomonas sp.]|uniref:hypothetical protein n=1 Tax=Hyphomonas sp. TaxID=87 RepID=UPI003567117A
SGTCTIDLPLDLAGTDVTVSLGIQTDAGAPVDNSSATNRVSTVIVDTAPSFKIAITPDTGATNATLASLFKAVATDSILGTVDVTANTVTYSGSVTDTVNTDLAGTNVLLADLGAVNLVVSGVMDAFDPNVLPAGGSFVFEANAFGLGVNSVADTATADIVASTTLGGNAGGAVISFVADGTSAVARSAYSAAVTAVPASGSDIKSSTSLTSALQSITRDGTQVTFPWTQTGTLGAASGTTSVYRIGNLDATAAGAVFVEAKNSTTAGYINPGIVQVAATIPAKGELVLNSSSVEAALGNYGRGDVEFTVEANSTSLTGRQFVVRNGAIQQVMGGTVSQDQN